MSMWGNGYRAVRLLHRCSIPKSVLFLAIAKSLCASGLGSRERTCHIAGREAGGQIGAADVLRQKSRIEAVSRSHWIHKIDFDWRASKTLGPPLSHGTLLPLLYYDQGDELC